MLNPGCLQGYDFANKFASDYAALEGLGYGRQDILRMLGTQQYVQDFADTPAWLEAVSKLPKGYRWADGRKFSVKAGKKNDAESYVLLSVGNDMYIRNLLNNAVAYGYKDEAGKIHWRCSSGEALEPVRVRIKDTRICVIRGWKGMSAVEVVNGLHAIMTPLLETAILTMWHENGVPLGWVEMQGR